MAHKIESMMSIRETPWHGLGKVLPAAVSFDEGFEHSGLNWRVKLVDIEAGGQKLAQFGRAVQRESDKKILGIVGPQWRPLQNREAFDWFAPFAEQGAVQLETAGSIAGGKIVWVLARIKGVEEQVNKGDTVRPYVLLSNAHDGSQAVRVGFTPIRVVCWNTLSAAQRDEASKLLKVRHTRQLRPTLAEVRDILNLAIGEFQATAAQYRRLAHRPVDKTTLRKYVTRVVCKPETADNPTKQEMGKVEEVIRLTYQGKGNEKQDPSLWTAYNGFTEYMAWQSGRSTDTRYESLWFGKGQDSLKDALEIALNMAI